MRRTAGAGRGPASRHVQKGVYREFVDRYVARAKTLKVGNGLDESIDMGPAVNEAQFENFISAMSTLAKMKARSWFAAETTSTKAYISMASSWSRPCSSTSIPKCGIAQEEIFGPVVSIIACDNLEDAIEIANNIEYGLSSSLYTKDVNKAFVAMRDLYAGITYINAPTIGAEVHLPFGGVKATGNGHREGGLGAIDFYTEWKAVYVDYSDKLQKAQIDRVD